MAKGKKSTEQVQAVTFPRRVWNPRDACDWLQATGHNCSKIIRSEGEFTYQQFPYRKCDSERTMHHRLSRYDRNGVERPLPKEFREHRCDARPKKRRKKKGELKPLRGPWWWEK